MGTYFSQLELARLRELRAVLLGIEGRPAGQTAPRYWRAEEDLALYDSTFAERIAWKWRAVLAELRERGFTPPAGGVLDFGCGTGVATREWFAEAERSAGDGASIPGPIALWDRDSNARRFARERLQNTFQKAKVTELGRAPEPRDLRGDETLLVSHLLDELDEETEEGLVALARAAGAVVWVEPGSRLTSRRLSGIRDRLLEDQEPVAPCTHAMSCGVLQLDPLRAWCHFFAAPAPEAFTEGRWAEFGRELGIDLRSVPYSFIALRSRRLAGASPEGDPSQLSLIRLLGRPRMQRGRALLDTCDRDGVREEVLLQRLDRALFKSLNRPTDPEPVRTLLIDRDETGIKAVRVPND